MHEIGGVIPVETSPRTEAIPGQSEVAATFQHSRSDIVAVAPDFDIGQPGPLAAIILLPTLTRRWQALIHRTIYRLLETLPNLDEMDDFALVCCGQRLPLRRSHQPTPRALAFRHHHPQGLHHPTRPLRRRPRLRKTKTEKPLILIGGRRPRHQLKPHLRHLLHHRLLIRCHQQPKLAKRIPQRRLDKVQHHRIHHRHPTQIHLHPPVVQRGRRIRLPIRRRISVQNRRRIRPIRAHSTDPHPHQIGIDRHILPAFLLRQHIAADVQR